MWTDRAPVQIRNRDGSVRIDYVYQWTGRCAACGREVRRVSERPFPSYEDTEVWCLDAECIARRKAARPGRRRVEEEPYMGETAVGRVRDEPVERPSLF